MGVMRQAVLAAWWGIWVAGVVVSLVAGWLPLAVSLSVGAAVGSAVIDLGLRDL